MELFTRTWGSHGAPAMVLLHGVTGDGGTWEEFAATMADRWHVIAPDQRGHGRSPHADAYSFALFADDLHGLLDQHDVEQAVLVGHSMGGVVAYRYAERHPNRGHRRQRDADATAGGHGIAASVGERTGA